MAVLTVTKALDDVISFHVEHLFYDVIRFKPVILVVVWFHDNDIQKLDQK